MKLLLALVLAAQASNTETAIRNPPNDAMAWHVSVVGSGSQFDRIVTWFSTYDQLMDLKRQVHFHAVSPGTVEFKTRYEQSILELPTVRMQRSDGSVLFEVRGKAIPPTPRELYRQMYPEIVKHSPRRDEKRPNWQQSLRVMAPIAPKQQCPGGTCPKKVVPAEVIAAVAPRQQPDPTSISAAATSTCIVLALIAVVSMLGGMRRRP